MDSQMVDLKRSKADMKEEMSGVTNDANPYPYGACLHLDTDELNKLGIKDLPQVGDEYHIMAVGKVTGVRVNEYEKSGESRGIDVQITMMQMVHEDEEPGEKDTSASENAEKKAGVKSVITNAMR